MDPATAPETDENKLSSCLGCRKRKLKCSRDVPVCAHCQRLDAPCVYDAKKNKPGIKSGAIESLSRRIDALEHALADRGVSSQSAGLATSESGPPDSATSSVVGLLSVLAQELQKLNARKDDAAAAAASGSCNKRPAPLPPPPRDGATVSPASSASWTRRAAESYGLPEIASSSSLPPSSKRRRVDSCGNPSINLVVPLEDSLDASALHLPPPDLLEAIVTRYFDAVQPWIPLLHETQFRLRIHDPDRLPRLVVVLHAMVVAAARFVRSDVHRLAPDDLEAMTAKARSIVLLNAMDELSVENLQALVIIAFNDIGSGHASRAWSVIGSLTRTVEYVQLSVEDEDSTRQPLLKPLPSLPPPQNWTEEEERRRVFWNIFMLDRFCSITTGWNTSLTADDVHRRLPADGFLWHKEEPVLTPFFGIWDRSVAKIGHSIAFLPALYPSQDQTREPPHAAAAPESPVSSSATTKNTPSGDMAQIGAFAYYVEATESLSQVTTYFLQQRINFQDRQEVSSWLTRFKELDLRLVHWKMFLPQRWKDSNVSRQPAIVNMDPNLALAHVTHNTSMILLHQQIAYPDASWTDIVKLPSFCSADTCQIAAIETATITEKYLKHTSPDNPVSNQFAFCVFVSARVLLVHWRRAAAADMILPEFWSLLTSLDDMARRWVGPHGSDHALRCCLAGRYVDQLRAMHRRCVTEPGFRVDVLGYPTVISDVPRDTQVSAPWSLSANSLPSETSPLSAPHADLLSTTSVAAAAAAGTDPSMAGQVATFPGEGHPSDELSAISHVLLDQRFIDMDRVISFDDSFFTHVTQSAGTTLAVNGWAGVEE